MLQGQSYLVLSALLALALAGPSSPQPSKPASPASGVSQSLGSNPSQQTQPTSANIESSYRQAPVQQSYGLNYAISPYYTSGHYAQPQSPSILPSRFLALPARRRSSFSSKLRNFMNAIFFRQGNKAAYSTDAYSYDPSVASKPYYLSPTSYKPIPVPVRQLQKYYKPYTAAESSIIPTYVSPYTSGSQSSYSSAALTGSSGNGVYGSSSYSYPVQSSYNIGGYQLPGSSSFSAPAYKRSSTGATTYTGPPQGGKVSFSKSK